MRRVFITCAGDAVRWGDHLGVPKQLVPVDGVPLLHRTVGQLQARGISDIHIVARTAQMVVPGTSLLVPRNCRWLAETILSTEPLWSDESIFLLGDVFFTSEGLDLILRNTWPVAVFGREGPSTVTGHPHGEIFALRVAEAASSRVRSALDGAVRLASMARGEEEVGSTWRTAAILLRDSLAVLSSGGAKASKKAIGRFSNRGPKHFPVLARSSSSLWATLRLVLTAIKTARSRRIHILGRLWSFYRLYTCQPLFTPVHIDTTVFVPIDDLTDDFDTPQDYDGWARSRSPA